MLKSTNTCSESVFFSNFHHIEQKSFGAQTRHEAGDKVHWKSAWGRFPVIEKKNEKIKNDKTETKQEDTHQKEGRERRRKRKK